MEEHNNNSNRPSGGGDNNKNPKNRQSILMFLIIAMVAILFWNYIGSMGNSSNTITYDEFVQMLDDGKVEKVEINSNSLKITAKEKDALGRQQIYTPELYRIISSRSAWKKRESNIPHPSRT